MDCLLIGEEVTCGKPIPRRRMLPKPEFCSGRTVGACLTTDRPHTDGSLLAAVASLPRRNRASNSSSALGSGFHFSSFLERQALIQKKPSVATKSSASSSGRVRGPRVPRRGPGLAPPPADLHVVRLAGEPQAHNHTTGAPAVERIAAVRSDDLNAPTWPRVAAIRSRMASAPAIVNLL